MNIKKSINDYFEIEKHGSSIKTEVVAGISTFMTMVFLLAVHPNIMSAAGMDKGAMTTVTIVSAAIFTAICGIYCKMPFALATAMGSNALLAYTIVGSGAATWEVALGMNFISGVLFILLTVCGIRDVVVKIIPKGLKVSMGAGVGLFILLTGLGNLKLVQGTAAGFLELGNVMTTEVLLAVITLVLIILLTARKVKGGLLIAMVVGTVIGIPLGLTAVPDQLVSLPPSMEPLMFKVNIKDALQVAYIPFILTFFVGDFFSTVGTLLGVGAKANLLDENGDLPNIQKPFLVDAIGTVVGTVMGTNTVTTYVQSAAGVEAGGRTGLTAVSTAICFMIALFFTPIAMMVPNAVSSAALIMIGLGMMTTLSEIDFNDYTEYLPAFISVMGTAFTYNIATGLSLGVIAAVIAKVGSGKAKEIHWCLYALCIPLGYYLVTLA